MSDDRRAIWCCACAAEVNARLTDGREVYAHRPDLASLPFWRCDACSNHVGCHYQTKSRTRPLGNIPTKELRVARGHIHTILDPIWKSRRMSRRRLYARLTQHLGREYHTAEIRTVEEARTIYRAVQEIARECADA